MRGLLLLLLVLPLITEAASPKPIRRNGYVMRTYQQDAELKDWIVGVQKETQHAQASEAAAKVERDAAQGKLTSTKVGLALAQTRIDTLQTNIAEIQKEADKVPGLETKAARLGRDLAIAILLLGLSVLGNCVLGYLLLKP